MSSLPNLTPTQVAHVLNRRLAARDIDAKVTPQMIYGYSKKGALRSAVIEGSPVTLQGDLVKTWMDAYIERRANGSAGTVDYDALAEQFA